MSPPDNERPSTEDVRVSGWPICDKCGANVLKPEYLMERVAELEAENQRLRDELRSEQMERSDAEREADRLREELDVLRETHDETQLARMQLQGERARLRAERADWKERAQLQLRHVGRLMDENQALRAAIEKLRDDVEDNLHDSDFVLSGWVARRLTELLDDERPVAEDAGCSEEDK